MKCWLLAIITILSLITLYLGIELIRCYQKGTYVNLSQTQVGPSFLVDPTIPGNPGVNWKQVKRRVFFNF